MEWETGTGTIVGKYEEVVMRQMRHEWGGDDSVGSRMQGGRGG